MKGIAQLAVAATLLAGAQASHQHDHRHHHAKRLLEKRTPAVKTAYVEGPTVVMYELDGKPVDAAQAKSGIADGLYSVVGETTPTFTPPPPPSTTAQPTSTTQAAQFFEQKDVPSSSSSAPAQSSSSPDTGATGIDADFPNGQIKCTELPTQYGARPIPWLGLEGWLSIQQPSNRKWIPGVTINTIDQSVSGGCIPGSFCSYACPNGYQKTQWPETSQGTTGQSIGGLWCNANGTLSLTRPEYPKLCEKGAGGVFVQNKLSGVSNVCQTNYPGDEKMSIALETKPGGKYEILNPDAKTSYQWKGSYTTAQFYLNNQDVDVEDACTWQSAKYPDSAGNWSPAILGIGKDIYGITYISLFKNKPTSNAPLNYNVEITGDVTAKCAVNNNAYTGGGDGCTTAISKPGGVAIIVFSK